MASVVSTPPLEQTADVVTQSAANTSVVNSVPAREQVHMGRAASAGQGVNWITVTAIGLFHVGAIAAFFFFTWQRLAVMAALYVLAINVGIGMCYHRLLTHRGYKCPLWLEHTLAILGVCTLQQSPARWVLVHRLHHQHSDHESDPHTPMVDWFWGHVGWLFIENRQTDLHFERNAITHAALLTLLLIVFVL